jgi:hypothetical protein
MARGSKLGGLTNAGSSPGDRSDRRRCIGCKRRIVYGDRCQPCQQKLRVRQRRKPR